MNPMMKNPMEGTPVGQLKAFGLNIYHSARTRSRLRIEPDGNSGFLSIQDGTTFCPPIRYMPREMELLALDYFMYFGRPSLGEMIIDVGGGMGTEMPTYSRMVGPMGQVLALEPHPKSFSILERIIQLNQLENVTAIETAIWSASTEVLLSNNPQSLGVNSVVDDKQLALGTIPVNATTLDQIASAKGIEAVGFLKINIEGAEVHALQGAEKLLGVTESVTVCCHDFVHRLEGGSASMCTKDAAREILLDSGFEIFERGRDRRPPIRDTLYGLRRGRGKVSKRT